MNLYKKLLWTAFFFAVIMTISIFIDGELGGKLFGASFAWGMGFAIAGGIAFVAEDIEKHVH